MLKIISKISHGRGITTCFRNTRRNNLREENDRYTVVLFGWAGCCDEDLARYSRIYEERGLNTVRVHLMCTGKEPTKADIGKLDPEINRIMNDNNNKLIIQLFSFNGLRGYISLLNYCDSKFVNGSAKLVSSTKGIIMDSAPFHVGPPQFGKATWMGIKGQLESGSPLLRTKAIILWTIVNTQFIYTYTIAKLRGSPDFAIYDRLLLNSRLLPFNQLYLYSSTDRVAPFEELESFIIYQKSLSSGVFSYSFQDTNHVKHLDDHPIEYIRTVNTFLNGIISSNVEKKVRIEAGSGK